MSCRCTEISRSKLVCADCEKYRMSYFEQNLVCSITASIQMAPGSKFRWHTVFWRPFTYFSDFRCKRKAKVASPHTIEAFRGLEARLLLLLISAVDGKGIGCKCWPTKYAINVAPIFFTNLHALLPFTILKSCEITQLVHCEVCW